MQLMSLYAMVIGKEMGDGDQARKDMKFLIQYVTLKMQRLVLLYLNYISCKIHVIILARALLAPACLERQIQGNGWGDLLLPTAKLNSSDVFEKVI